MNHLEKYGNKLIRMGYDIVPIKHKKKYPGVKGWQNIEASPEDIAGWVGSGHTGVGVLCKNTPAVDLDIRDWDLTLFMVKEIRELCGKAPHRVGQKPKALLPFKVITPFKKLSSKKFIDSEGSVHQVEVLGDGGQFVAFGIHPGTGEEYKWSQPLYEVRREDLPTLNVVDAKEIIKIFEEECGRRGWKNSRQSGEKSDELSVVSNSKANSPEGAVPLGVSIVKMKKYLNAIDPGGKDYDEWVKVGMAVHHETGGSDEGFELWQEWSERSPVHDENCKGTPMWKKWESFKDGEGSATFRSVIKEANAVGTVEDHSKLGEFLRRYVYVEIENEVHDLWSPQELPNIPLQNFKVSQAGCSMVIEVPTKKTDENGAVIWEEKTVSVVDQWVKHKDRQTARGVVYEPCSNGERVVKKHGHLFLNSFRLPEFKLIGGDLEGRLGVFFEHMEYLFPVKEEREWFLNWMAVNVQHPENRCKVTPLHVNVHQGTGRGWVVELMSKLLGVWNCQKVDIRKLAGESQYNGFLAGSLLVSVEEVHEAGKGGFSVLDKIRGTLTENYLNVNKKFGAEGTIRVYANFFFMSNHIDALRIDTRDRRINVFLSDEREREPSYYMRLYGWSKGAGWENGEEVPCENVRALYWWLMGRKMEGDWWMRSFRSKGRDRVIEAGRSEIEVAFRDYLEEPDWPVMTAEKIIENMAKIQEDPFFCSDNMGKKQIERLLQNTCKSLGKKVRTGGKGKKVVRPWVLKDDNFDMENVKKMIEEQYEQQRG